MKTGQLLNQPMIETSPQIQANGFAGEQLMVVHFLFEEGAIGASHAHPHEQISLVLSGEIEFTLDGERKIVKAGETVAIPSNVVHGVVAIARTELLDIFTPVRLDLLEKLQLTA